jgi:hypothetical protein
MQMIDVLAKLKEIESRSPEELGRAINTLNKFNSTEVPVHKVAETKAPVMPQSNNSNYMVDVLSKLKEISNRSPEIAHAIDNASRMGTNVAEGIEIKTSGDDAILAQILKLAGMVGGVNTPDMAAAHGDAPVSGEIPHAMVPSEPETPAFPSVGAALPNIAGGPDMEVTMDDAPMGGDVDERPYNNSPHEIYKSPRAAVPSGNDLAKPKLTAPKVAGGDNPTHVAVSFD